MSGTSFLRIPFRHFSSRAECLATIFRLASSGDSFAYAVTPNVDHIVKLESSHASIRPEYLSADLVVCDSRILSDLAVVVGKELFVYPGSDITADLLAACPGDVMVGVAGPRPADVQKLEARYPGVRFHHFPVPSRLEIGSQEFASCVRQMRDGTWNVLLLCLGFPKQECLAFALREAGRRSGVALCVGASIDFLVGTQMRAPAIFQRLHAEWLFRMLSSPRRLARRYIGALAPLLRLYLSTELLQKLRSRER